MENEKVVDEKQDSGTPAHCVFCDRTGKMNQITINILKDKVEALNDTAKAVRYVQMAHDHLAEGQMRELLTLAAFIHDMELADKTLSAKEAAEDAKEAEKKNGNTDKSLQDGSGELG